MKLQKVTTVHLMNRAKISSLDLAKGIIVTIVQHITNMSIL